VIFLSNTQEHVFRFEPDEAARLESLVRESATPETLFRELWSIAEQRCTNPQALPNVPLFNLLMGEFGMHLDECQRLLGMYLDQPSKHCREMGAVVFDKIVHRFDSSG
jgi:hypothetical protein